MESKVTHFMYVPFTGLGLYGGHRGNRWLKNRIRIFKQFVVPSLLAQTNQDFSVWVSWRFEDRHDPIIHSLKNYLESMFPKRVVFTFAGVCFWDDKFPDEVARERLVNSVHDSMGELINHMESAETIIMTIQPSDDCYWFGAVDEVQKILLNENYQAVGYKHGYVMDYASGRIKEWNPKTNPPFFSIKFSREVFTDPLKHLEYTGPYKSHEYVGDKLKYLQLAYRGFLVGTHGENISTVFNHPFAGNEAGAEERSYFGIAHTGNLKIHLSLRKWLMRKLPAGWQRKLRYWLGERFFAVVYNWIRS
jgi:hypothetical protein